MTEQATGLKSSHMRGIRREGTSAELAVGRALRSLGQRYRKNVRTLPGSPDFANRTKKWVVFVDGCFWHRHTACVRATIPKTNKEFWLDKLARNRKRDAKAIRSVRALGMTAIVVWECETGNERALRNRLLDIFEARGIGVSQPVDH